MSASLILLLALTAAPAEAAEPAASRATAHALEFIRAGKLDLTRHDLMQVTAARYCPPQPTVYEWFVEIPPQREGVESIFVAVPAQGKPWLLDPKTLERR